MKCPICAGEGIITVEAEHGDKRTGCVACHGSGSIPFLLWVPYMKWLIKRNLGLLKLK